jgi:hypothetical protein
LPSTTACCWLTGRVRAGDIVVHPCSMLCTRLVTQCPAHEGTLQIAPEPAIGDTVAPARFGLSVRVSQRGSVREGRCRLRSR